MPSGSAARAATCATLFIAALLCGAASRSAAQAVIIGRVTSVAGGEPVANAELWVAGSPGARADSAGAFRLVVAHEGAVTLAVRAVGHRPLSRRLDIRSGDSVRVELALEAIPQELDSVVVREEAPVISPKMIGFEERRRAGFGHFYPREFLAERETSLLSNVLRLSNLQLIRLPFACGGGYAVATGRGGTMDMEIVVCGAARQRVGAACYASVYLDGVPYWGPGWGPPPNIDQLKVMDLEGVEVYRSAVEAPLLFQTFRSPCGAIALWTRVGGSSR